MHGRRTLLILLALTLALSSVGCAQDVLGPPAPGRRSYDGVRGIIGDRVILQSTLEREIRSQIEAAGLSTKGKVSREIEMQIRNQVTTRFARDEIWIEYGKSLGEQDPRQFEKAIDSEVDAQLKDEIRASGGILQYDRDVGDLGTSWSDLRRQKRNSILTQIAKRNAIAPLIHNQGLMVTPREIRAFYEEHPERYSQKASADIARIGFSIGRDPAAVEAKVKQAAEAWSSNRQSASQVAAEFGGIVLETQRGVTQDPSDPRSKTIKEFALANSEGDVSAPQRSRRTIYLFKIQSKVEAKELAFGDPEVQTSIRERLAETHYIQWQNDVLSRKRRNIYTWPNSLDLER